MPVSAFAGPVENLLHETVRAQRNRLGPVFAVEIRKRRFQARHFSSGCGIWTRFSSGSMANNIRLAGGLSRGRSIRTGRHLASRSPGCPEILHKAMKRYGRPEVIVTDLLRSFPAVIKVIGNAEYQETGRWLNNRAEN